MYTCVHTCTSLWLRLCKTILSLRLPNVWRNSQAFRAFETLKPLTHLGIIRNSTDIYFGLLFVGNCATTIKLYKWVKMKPWYNLLWDIFFFTSQSSVFPLQSIFRGVRDHQTGENIRYHRPTSPIFTPSLRPSGWGRSKRSAKEMMGGSWVFFWWIKVPIKF